MRSLLLSSVAAICCAVPTFAGTIVVQPIIVCDDTGLNCANPGGQSFGALTDMIWAQAGLNVNFLGSIRINNSFFLNIPSEFMLNVLWTLPGEVTGASPISNIISMWFVNSLPFGADGVALTPGNRIAISNNIFRFENPTFGGRFDQMPGRVDTIAHEIGHSLGLDHCEPYCDASFLMAENRNIPASLIDISPYGNYDRLSSDEIGYALSSPLVQANSNFQPPIVITPPGYQFPGPIMNRPSGPRVPRPRPGRIRFDKPPAGLDLETPEPGTWTLLLAGIALIAVSRLRRLRRP